VRVAVVCLAVGCAFKPTPDETAPNDAPVDALTSAQIDAPPEGLVAYYPMDSLPMIDATGHGHDGSCSACPTLGSGVIGSAYAFAGDRVDVPPMPDMQTESGTAVAWIAFDTLPTSYACPFGTVFQQPTNGNTWQLCRNAAEWSVFLDTEGSGKTELDFAQTIMAGQWHYVAIVWTPNQCALYVDGALGVASPIGSLVFDPAGLFTFGADRLANGNVDVPMTGRLDEMKIFSRDLSPGELATMMQQR
jgi:Concanavalin A-like lectin/glucanases superfamily